MEKYSQNLFSIIAAFTMVVSCGTSAKLYRFDDNSKTYTGQLSDSTYTSLKKYLTKATNKQLKDSIIIKYEYNNETCWSLLDEREDDYIMNFVKTHQEKVRKMESTRPGVSVFDFREPGNKFNKIKKWDKSIIIDSTKQLFDLLFKERCTCGSSIIIMPNKTFVFMRSDSHTEILDLTKKQIENILSKN